MELDELIAMVKIRPGMFLGDNMEIKSLYHFINGFLCSNQSSSNAKEYEIHFNQEFRDFIIQRHVYPMRDRELFTFKTWYEIIQYLSENSATELTLFFTLYEAFRNEKKE
jgi:hypothetical protein